MRLGKDIVARGMWLVHLEYVHLRTMITKKLQLLRRKKTMSLVHYWIQLLNV